jgi:TolB-like protein
MKREIIILYIFVLAFFSCASKPSFFNKEEIDRKNSKIAVIPFIDYNKNEGNNSGELVRSVFEAQLITNDFNVVEIEKISSNIHFDILKKYEFSGDWLVETGKSIGADYIIYGSVHDYKMYQNTTSFLYIFSWLETTASVGITARLVSCKTGEVMWHGSYTRSSYDFNNAANEAVKTLIRSIKRNAEK